jgi:hypothetical protein
MCFFILIAQICEGFMNTKLVHSFNHDANNINGFNYILKKDFLQI